MKILLLGAPLIMVNDAPLTITRRRSRAVLYFLAENTQPVMRERLLTMFWPHQERSAAQQSLRTALHSLRKTLDDWLIVTDEALALAPGVFVDVREQNAHLNPPADDPALLHSTLELYHGDFLTGVTLNSAPDFDDWQVTQSEHYRRLTIRGWAALSEQHIQAGDYAAAMGTLDRALALDELQEELQRSALRLHYWMGDRAGAIRRYERLRQVLTDEMGVPPMKETRDVYDAIINDKLEGPTPTQPTTPLTITSNQQAATARTIPHDALPFAGRSAELATLHNLISTTPHKLALIEGEPGIGKTRLAHEVIATTGATLLVGRAHELENTLPYQPVIEILRSVLALPGWNARFRQIAAALPGVWLTETARLLPELLPQSPAAAVPDEARLWEGVSQFLRTLAQHHPIMVLFDDLQWADTSTLGLLSYLVRKTASRRLIYFATLRTHAALSSPLAALLQTLTRTDQLLRIPLVRLDHHDIDQIAQRFSTAYAYPLGEWLTRSSEGNPYVLAELIRHLRTHNVLQANGQLDLTWLSSSPVVPQTVYSLIETRLAQLPEDARRVLDIAVAIGREFEFDVVYRAAELSETAALDALEHLTALGLVQPHSETSYTFDHHLTMEVAYREAGEVRHRLFHRRVAETLEVLHSEDDGQAGVIASHFIEGNTPERAVPYVLRAAQHATHLAAWSEAITFYERAYGIEKDDAQRLTILMALADTHFNAGHTVQASDTYQAALQLAETLDDDAHVYNTRLALAQSLLPQARFDEAVAIVEHYPPPHNAASTIFAVKAELTIGTALSLEGADLDDAAQHLRQGIAYLEHNDAIDPIYGAHLAFELGSVAAQQGDLEQAVELYRNALADAERSNHQEAALRTILAYNNLAYHLHLLNDPGAQELIEAGLEYAESVGMLTLQPYLFSTRGEILLAQGDLSAADAQFQQGLALAQQFSNLERVAGLTANRGRVALAQGDTTRAMHYLSTALARADAVGTRHLAARIRLWLVPLLPENEARIYLNEARAIAQNGRRQRLLDEIARLEHDIFGI